MTASTAVKLKESDIIPFNMHNLLKFDSKPPSKRKSLKRSEEVEKAIKSNSNINTLKECSDILRCQIQESPRKNDLSWNSLMGVLYSPIEDIIKQNNSVLEEAVSQHVMDNGSIPSELESFIKIEHTRYNSIEDNVYSICNLDEYQTSSYRSEKFDVVTKMACTPSTSLSNIISVAEQMNLIVIPYEYLDERSFKDESVELRNSIVRFNRASSKAGMTSYVICPVSHYSIRDHIKHLLKEDRKDLPMYISSKFVHIFESINMMLPILCEFSNRISQVEDDVRVNSKNIDSLDGRIKELDTRIQQVSDRLDREISARRSAEEARQLAELQKLQSRSSVVVGSLSFWDPMIFSIENGKDINDGDVRTFVGPCWGPEIPELFLRLNNISIQNKKDSNTKLVNRLFKD